MKFKVFSKIRFFFLIYSVMIFSACHDSDKIEPKYGERTVLIYMAADNNLNKDGETNIKSILKGMEQTAGRLVIYIDPRGITYSVSNALKSTPSIADKVSVSEYISILNLRS